MNNKEMYKQRLTSYWLDEKDEDKRETAIAELQNEYVDKLTLNQMVEVNQKVFQLERSNVVQLFTKKKIGFTHPDLILTNTGKPVNNRNNIVLCLLHHDSFKKLDIYYSSFENCYFSNSTRLEDQQVLSLAHALGKIFQKNIDVKVCLEAIQVIGNQNSRNILKDWFEALPKWDGKKRLSNLLSHYYGAVDNNINSVMGKKWMISGVARAYQPGCHMEGCLILAGRQGTSKSLSLRKLCPKEEWFTDTILDLKDTKKTAEICVGKFLIEMAELSTLKQTAKLEAAKSFLTATSDTYRGTYQLLSRTTQRQQFYAGTTNEDEFLIDRTGNRRWWCVSTGDINIQELIADKNQLWAEAKELYLNNHSWVLTAEEVKELEETKNSKIMVPDPYFDCLAKMTQSEDEIQSYTFPDLLILLQFYNLKDAKQISKAMLKLGFEKKWVGKSDRITYVRHNNKEAK